MLSWPDNRTYLLYYLLKFWVRFALQLYCKEVRFYNRKYLLAEGPFLIAAHHPNSFFDAILVGTYTAKPVHFLTRSDVFVNPIVRFLLRRLKMIPVYRIRDGKDKLGLNEHSFRKSTDALARGGHILIFAEGFCEHQTTLQPLKKGAARILLQSWQEGLNVSMLPLWLRYSKFQSIGQCISIRAAVPFTQADVDLQSANGNALQAVNRVLANRLKELEEMPEQQHAHQCRWLLTLPALLGWLLHAPLYYTVEPPVRHFFQKTIHYDSVLFVLLALLYPFWLVGLTVLLYTITANTFFLGALLLLPLTARAFILWK